MTKATRVLNGYKVVYLPNNPSAMQSDNWSGYVYEHVAVAEELLGRQLYEDEVVHHLNGERADNRPNNLLVLLRGQHSKLHKWLDAGAPGLERFGAQGVNSGESKEEELRYCAACDTPLVRRQKRYCSRACSDSNREARPNKPTEQELAYDMAVLSWEAIGRKYGVSSNACRKWARKYDLL